MPGLLTARQWVEWCSRLQAEPDVRGERDVLAFHPARAWAVGLAVRVVREIWRRGRLLICRGYRK